MPVPNRARSRLRTFRIGLRSAVHASNWGSGGSGSGDTKCRSKPPRDYSGHTSGMASLQGRLSRESHPRHAARAKYSFFIPRVFHEESPQHRDAEGKGCPEDVLEERRTLLQPFVNRIGLCFFGSHYRADVFQEVYSALFTGSTLALLVAARRALKAKCGVAARAKAGHLAHRRCALRAFRHGLRSRSQRIARGAAGLSGRSATHIEILPGRELEFGRASGGCILGVNPAPPDRGGSSAPTIETREGGSGEIHSRSSCHSF